MKNTLIIIITLFITGCKNESSPEIKTVEIATAQPIKSSKFNFNPDATFAKAEFKIKGMTCAMGCAKTIENKIARMEGVKNVVVNFKEELAMVEYDNAVVTPSGLRKTVTSVADTYKVKDIKTVDHFSLLKK